MPSQRNNHGRIQGRAGVALRERRLANEPLCAECLKAKRVTAATTVDHIIPLYQGGLDIDTNCQSLCDPCHDRKTADDLGYKAKQQIGTDGWPIS
jgi:5-methylcytosine-specific restriction enzyme A